MYCQSDISLWRVEQFRRKINLLFITLWNLLPSGGCSKSRRNVVWSKRDFTHKCSLRVETKLWVFVPCVSTTRSWPAQLYLENNPQKAADCTFSFFFPANATGSVGCPDWSHPGHLFPRQHPQLTVGHWWCFSCCFSTQQDHKEQQLQPQLWELCNSY